VIGSVHLWAKLRAALGGALPVRALARTAAGALLMSLPAFLTAVALSPWIGKHELGQIAVVAVATIVGAGVYLLAQAALKAPELGLLRLGTRSLVRGDDR
jgi:hypothetical protein